MDVAPGRTRLALTVFAEPAPLWRTTARLLDAGFSEQQLCIAAADFMLDRLAPDTGVAGSDLARIYAGLRQWSGSISPRLIMASNGPLLTLALGMIAAVGAPRRADAAARSDVDLVRLVYGGGVALISQSNDPAQQALATRTLLADAQNRVTTYEQPGAPT